MSSELGKWLVAFVALVSSACGPARRSEPVVPKAPAPAARVGLEAASGGTPSFTAPDLPANVEDTLLARLSQPLHLYARPTAGAVTECESLLLSADSEDRTRVRQDSPLNPLLWLHGGALRQGTILAYFRLHGQSARSLLMNSREWFFEQEACVKNPGQAGANDAVDAAQRLWAFDDVLFVPIVRAHAVTCEALDLRAARDGGVAKVGGWEGRRYRLRRMPSGVRVEPGTGPARVGPEEALIVHGFDADSFYVAGSRWFVSERACAAARDATKPVNFDPLGYESEEPRAIGLARGYFRLDRQAEPPACAELNFEPLTPTLGRVEQLLASGREFSDFDFYPLDKALWIGAPHATPPIRGRRLAGELHFLEKEPAGLRVGNELWFTSSGACAKAAH